MAVGGLCAVADDGRNAAYSLSISGVAGPGGGTPDKPVGTVWIGLAQREATGGVRATARRFLIPGDRQTVRRRSAQNALAMLRMRLLAAEAPLLWEQPGG
jgi:nicotinamide mononucleotide (NMN) deamidase PncC